jgi:hypothetical protein
MIAIAAVAIGCSGIKVSTDYNPEAEFASLKKYAWLPKAREKTGNPRLDSPLLRARIEQAIEDTLAAKGYRLADVADADFFVNYHVGIEAKVDVTSVPTMYGYGRWGGIYTSETRVDQYDQGTLLIDIVDREQDDLIWRGSGQARVNQDGSPRQREERVRKAVAAILKQFPPQ